MPDTQYMHPRLAEVYDISDDPYPEERAFFLDLAGEGPTRVLDLGCGVGKLALGFAEAGHGVIGVDPASAMLDVARAKPGSDKVRWISGTAQEVRLGEHFDFIIMTGHAFQVMLSDEDIRGCLETMKQHLAPGGHIVFDTRNPALDWVARWDERPVTTWDLGEDGTVSISTHVMDRSEARISFEHHFQFRDETLTSSSMLRFTSRAEVAVFLEHAGLSVEACYGDWDLSAFDPKVSPEMIFVAAASQA